MTSAQVRVQKSRNAQSNGAKRATAELFTAKKAHEEEKSFKVNGEEVTVLMRAVGKRTYDKLLTECPPSTAQKATGASYDQDKFAPKLLALVVVDPAMSEADWRNIWNGEEWNRAELGDLFFAAVDVCSVGSTVDVNPTESG